MKRRSILFAAFYAAFAAGAALAWGSTLYGATAEPPQPGPAQATIQAGVDFDVPLLVAGKATIGRGHVNAENVLRVYWVVDGRIAGPLLLRIGGDVQPVPPPPPPHPPPVPVKRITDFYIVWETGEATVAVGAIRNNQAFKDELTKAKIRYGAMDQDNGEKLPRYKPVVEAARKATLPAIVTVDEFGGIKAEPIPAQLLAEKAKPGPAVEWILGAAKKAGGVP